MAEHAEMMVHNYSTFSIKSSKPDSKVKKSSVNRLVTGAISFPARDSKCPIDGSSISSRVFADLHSTNQYVKFESAHFR